MLMGLLKSVEMLRTNQGEQRVCFINQMMKVSDSVIVGAVVVPNQIVDRTVLKRVRFNTVNFLSLKLKVLKNLSCVGCFLFLTSMNFSIVIN